MDLAELQSPCTPLDARAGRLTEIALDYQRRLEQNPADAQSMVGMSVVAIASAQPQAAVQMAAAAVSLQPAMYLAWVTLGQALNAAGSTEAAERAYRQAIQLDGNNELARLCLGELKLVSGCIYEAITEFELAIQRSPVMVAAHLGLGNALAADSRFSDALHAYESALALRPQLPEAEFGAGFVLTRLHRPEEAELRYRRALVARPDFAAAWMNLGSLLREQGQDIFAEAALRRAVELRPDLVAGWINLAVLERERSRPDETERHLRKAFSLNPNQVETAIAWCQFRSAQKDRAGAWAWLRWALLADPDQPEANNMHGILLHGDERFSEAIKVFEHAERLGHPSAASNRGNALLDMGRVDEALAAHRKAVAHEPDHPGALYNLALTQLRLGDWAIGWPAYEARLRFREVHRRVRRFEVPRWNGEPLHGDTVLLHAEQGLGDTIQFCRYIPMVAARGARIVLEVQPAVLRLLRSLAPVRAGAAEVFAMGTPLPAFNLECPLMSLPAVFGTTVDTVPWNGAYLGAQEKAIRARASSCTALSGSGKIRVGIAWAGNPRYRADHQRSVCLKILLPLLRTKGIAWTSLQKGPAADELDDLPKYIRISDGSRKDRDLADTAAHIGGLDLVICTDTCIAHLAGAMGKPVWILLPHLSDWRWMQNSETTPWYPTARLFRQRAAGDWEELVGRTTAELSSSSQNVARHQSQEHDDERPAP